jgi:hypothetical protein
VKCVFSLFIKWFIKLCRLLNYTINREEIGLSLEDCNIIFDELSNNNKVGRTVAMDWMISNFDDIVDSLGNSGFASWIIDGFAITSNSQSDLDLINQFVNEHQEDLQGSLSSIQSSINKAELNIQWNELHAEKVYQWLDENYGERETTTSTTTSTTASTSKSSSTLIKPNFALLILTINVFKMLF